MNWTENSDHSYSIGNYGNITINATDSIAAYDLDHTIIMPKKGKLFLNKNVDEWIFLDNIIDKIKESTIDKKFIIVTNQKKLNKKNDEFEIWKTKVYDVLYTIGVPCLVLVSFKEDRNRKPSPFIVLDNFSFNKENAFYCGDAGGINKAKTFKINTKTITHEKDFSDTDYKFALNLGIKFIHRNEYVYNDRTDLPLINYPNLSIDVNKYTDSNHQINKNTNPEMIILVGMPGSGKSTLAKKYVLLGYQVINQDTLKTEKKCLCETTKLLENNEYVVIDNTNPSKKSRQKYIEIAKKYNYHIKCIFIDTEKSICKHNNIYRNIVDPSRVQVPEIAYRMFTKYFELPTSDENINEMIRLDFEIDDQYILPEYNYYYY